MPRALRTRAEVVAVLAEIFREHGFEGASLGLVTARTGLGKGSLYNFFPGGKDEMLVAVLEDIDGWFARNVFEPLRADADPRAAIRRMLDNVDAYFRSGERVCLIGVLALGEVRGRFAERIAAYFAAWRGALADALERAGHVPPVAADLAEDAIASIQGALVAGRALNDRAVFARMLARLAARLGVV